LKSLRRCGLDTASAVSVLRARDPGHATYRHAAELWFHVVLRGELTLDGEHRHGAAEDFAIPAGQPFTWSDASSDLELLEIALPGRAVVERVG
jgi:hypothetical protein